MKFTGTQYGSAEGSWLGSSNNVWYTKAWSCFELNWICVTATCSSFLWYRRIAVWASLNLRPLPWCPETTRPKWQQLPRTRLWETVQTALFYTRSDHQTQWCKGTFTVLCFHLSMKDRIHEMLAVITCSNLFIYVYACLSVCVSSQSLTEYVSSFLALKEKITVSEWVSANNRCHGNTYGIQRLTCFRRCWTK